MAGGRLIVNSRVVPKAFIVFSRFMGSTREWRNAIRLNAPYCQLRSFQETNFGACGKVNRSSNR